MTQHIKVRSAGTAGRAKAAATGTSRDEALRATSPASSRVARTDVLRLQQAAGNRATRRLLSSLEGSGEPAADTSPHEVEPQPRVGTVVGRATASAVQLMTDHKKNAVNDLASLNAYLGKNSAENFPDGGLTSAHFANSPKVTEVDAAIKALDTKIYMGIDVDTLVASIDSHLGSQGPAFSADDYTTWNVTVSDPDGATSNLQPNWLTALQEGSLVDNSTAGGAKFGVKYHAHTSGGSGGIAFRYVHGDGNEVTAEVYDYATKRQQNKYVWINAGKTQSGPP
jgi:hypothetical protein